MCRVKGELATTADARVDQVTAQVGTPTSEGIASSESVEKIKAGFSHHCQSKLVLFLSVLLLSPPAFLTFCLPLLSSTGRTLLCTVNLPKDRVPRYHYHLTSDEFGTESVFLKIICV